jgi:predicted membrane channel-forming protein YqfA (hemolysin III family)
MPNLGLVGFSLLFLYWAVAAESAHGHSETAVVLMMSLQGSLFCIGPVLAWQLRWGSLDRNYRQIAVFLYVVFGLLLILLLRNMVQAALGGGQPS